MIILIFIPWFYPAYKAGGPIQSITNLIISLEDQYKFYVVASAYDLQSDTILEDVTANDWNSIDLPGCKKQIAVWYSTQSSYTVFKHLLKTIKPDVIYLNSIFSYNFFLLPLIIRRAVNKNLKAIICPRGMLQNGALETKKTKKKIYLDTLKFSGLLKGVKWHATNEEERKDIQKNIGFDSHIVVAQNIPKPPVGQIIPINKNAGSLKLLYLSLITEKKNLLFLLQLVKKIDNISLDIFGPVKDKKYWLECEKLIKQMAGKVSYNGDILPINVQTEISKYHALVLLTKGENFGHALYESLSTGRPIITSHFTPWNNLQEQQAGWNLDINDEAKCLAVFYELRELADDNYAAFCSGAYKLAQSFYNSTDIIMGYHKLFNV